MSFDDAWRCPVELTSYQRAPKCWLIMSRHFDPRGLLSSAFFLVATRPSLPHHNTGAFQPTYRTARSGIELGLTVSHLDLATPETEINNNRQFGSKEGN